MKLGAYATSEYCKRLLAIHNDIASVHHDLKMELCNGGPGQIPEVGDDLVEATTAIFNAQQRLAAIEGYPSLPRRIWQRLAPKSKAARIDKVPA